MKKIFYSMMVLAVSAISFTSCEDVPMPYSIGGDETGQTETKTGLPYANANLKDWTVKTVKGIDWSLGATYAKASGYANSTYTETESWLVSPVIETTTSTGAVVTFDHVIRYVKNNEELGNHELYISTDYTDDVTKATWTKLAYKPAASETNSWDFYAANKIQIPAEYLNKKVNFAFKFVCSSSNSTTWEIKNFKVSEGTDGDTDVTPDTPAVDAKAEGDGTEANPYNVPAVQQNTEKKSAFVKGYIVGYIYGKTLAEGARFGSDTCSVATNLLVAASADETNVANCIPVQLPSGAVRTALNLKDNKANNKQEVLLYGSLENYFGAKAVKSVSYAKLGGKEFGTKPGAETNPSTGDAKLSATFKDGQDNFTITDVKLGEGASYVWKHDAKNGYMKASAYVSKKNIACQSLLVSPAFSLAGVKSATLSFDHASNYASNMEEECQVLASTDGKTWTKLKVSAYSDGKSWTFVSATADLSAFAGKSQVYVAFQYTSSSDAAPTWEIKNVAVK